MSGPTYGDRRPKCEAKAHDTSGAYVHHGCRCPLARAARRALRQAYEARNPDRNRPWRPKPPVDRTVDNFVVGLLREGTRVPGASRYDRREAARRLLPGGAPTSEIARQVGLSRRTVERMLGQMSVIEATQRVSAILAAGGRVHPSGPLARLAARQRVADGSGETGVDGSGGGRSPGTGSEQ